MSLRRRHLLSGSNKPNIIKNYFSIISLEDGLTVSFSKSGLEYSINDGAWNSLGSGINTSTVNAGDKISFRGALTPSSSSGIGKFTISKKCSVQGNIMSLLFGDNFKGKNDLTGYDYAFYNLFNGCKKLIDAINLILPATELAGWCYYGMFMGCNSLTTAPELPATTLANYCYSNMFNGCTSLTTPPSLPSTTLANSCYSNMFNSCNSLTTPPSLPSTTLASSCYESMFSGCTGLTTAPELPATTLANYCYYYMFQGCNSLNKIKMLATDISATNCLYKWVYGVASSGTFVKNPSMTSLPSGYSGIPTGWTVEDYNPNEH